MTRVYHNRLTNLVCFSYLDSEKKTSFGYQFRFDLQQQELKNHKFVIITNGHLSLTIRLRKTEYFSDTSKVRDDEVTDKGSSKTMM